jgi:hypothetical protein
MLSIHIHALIALFLGYIAQAANGATIGKKDPQGEKTTKWRNKLIKQWQPLLGFDGIDEAFFMCLHYIHPQPQDKLIAFKDEIIGSALRHESKAWMEHFFQESADPFRFLKTPKKYFLASTPGESSLLFYEWSSKKYSFTLLESSSAVLVLIKPLKQPFDPKHGIPGKVIATILDDTIKINKRPKIKTINFFRLPIQVSRGTIFSNAEALDWFILPNWEDQIIGFLSSKGLYVLLFKAWKGRMAGGLPLEKDWLPIQLYEKDGETLVSRRKKKGK